jgi:hypothetical protein
LVYGDFQLQSPVAGGLISEGFVRRFGNLADCWLWEVILKNCRLKISKIVARDRHIPKSCDNEKNFHSLGNQPNSIRYRILCSVSIDAER